MYAANYSAEQPKINFWPHIKPRKITITCQVTCSLHPVHYAASTCTKLRINNTSKNLGISLASSTLRELKPNHMNPLANYQRYSQYATWKWLLALQFNMKSKCHTKPLTYIVCIVDQRKAKWFGPRSWLARQRAKPKSTVVFTIRSLCKSVNTPCVHLNLHGDFLFINNYMHSKKTYVSTTANIKKLVFTSRGTI